MKSNQQTQKKEVLIKEDFLNTLKKVTKPIPKSSEKEKSKTSADRLFDDYNEKHTR